MQLYVQALRVLSVALFLLVTTACRPEREPEEEPEKGPELPRPQTPAD